MALYAIGDVQGCFAELRRLLDKIQFDAAQDQLWFTGDLVNRGPDSLATLRFIKALGPAAVAVLGNHDLHLLAVASGASRTKHKDTFGDVLAATDRDELLEWLRRLPLCHRDQRFTLVHAGVAPQWTVAEAHELAAEAQAVLAGEQYREFLPHLYGDRPDRWSGDLTGWDRLRCIVNCLTRLRYCDRQGRLDFKEKGAPGTQPPALIPWFDVPDRNSQGSEIVFGHWSALGFRRVNGCYALDTGCLWGGELTALRLDGDMRCERVPSLRNRRQLPSSKLLGG
jgi:bis(5'-nucleosyl)-tetraphosphatase (symmetrical)